jgi:hypothetical protein
MNDEQTRTETLPAVPINDFDATGSSDRLIKGTILRCVDGRWADRNEISFPTGTVMLALGTTQALQHWQDGMPIDAIVKQAGQPLPDVQELNAKIPEEAWDLGLDNKPRPPWVLQFVVYLLDPNDASTYTFINSTIGARIAVEHLENRVRAMRMLRGARVVPLIKLDSRPMTTKYGQKMRPEFTIVDWRELGAGLKSEATPQIEHRKSVEQIGRPVEPITTKEELDDQIPF